MTEQDTKLNQWSKLLMDEHVLRLNITEPFTYSSGIKSPVYCDHRILLGRPEARSTIVNAWASMLKEHGAEQLAGVATAGIPWAAFLADKLGLPMGYVRAQAKAHGAGKQIEGSLDKNLKTFVIEDLVSTGGSSLHSAQVLRDQGYAHLQVSCIFTYHFESATRAFRDANLSLKHLICFLDLLRYLELEAVFDSQELTVLRDWQQDPEGWSKKLTSGAFNL